MPDTCTATSKAGTPCRARPMEGAPTCFLHGPDAQAARARGGRTKAHGRPQSLPPALQGPDLTTGPKIIATLDQAAKDLAAGVVSANHASALAALGRLALATLLKDQGERIARLEKLAEAKQPQTIGRRR